MLTAAQVLERVRPAVGAAMAAHSVPGVAMAVALGGGPSQTAVFGSDGGGAALRPEALFPVASVTKLGIALAVLRLADAGALSVDDRLGRHVPEAAAADATLRQLLTHTSGLEREAEGDTWDEVAGAALGIAPTRPAGERVVYSTAGNWLLGVVVERLTGRTLPEAYRELATLPLGAEGYFGLPSPPPIPIADDIDPPHRLTRLIVDARGALALARAFGGVPEGILKSGTVAAATTDQTGGLAGGYFTVQYERCPWGLGPELRGDKEPHWAPREASPGSFGHYGSGGRFAWVDPRAGVSWAILSTRFLPSGIANRDFMAGIGRAILAAAAQQR